MANFMKNLSRDSREYLEMSLLDKYEDVAEKQLIAQASAEAATYNIVELAKTVGYTVNETYLYSVEGVEREFAAKQAESETTIYLGTKYVIDLTSGPGQDQFKVLVEDYLKYLGEHPEISPVMMDTVEGKIGGKVLLTIYFCSCHLMLIYLLEEKRQINVKAAFDMLETMLGPKLFRKLFQVILTDYAEKNTMPKNCWSFAA